MVKPTRREVRIYVEGGGEEGDGRAKLRIGLQAFIKSLRQDRSVSWNITASGGRKATYDEYCQALTDHPHALNILLVDSEAGVREGCSPWTHLRERRGDGWSAQGPEDRCHLMVSMMESWLLADPEALARFYGKGFHPSALPSRFDVEAIPKAEVEEALKRATQDTHKGKYHKIRHGTDLLALISPEKVQQRARHCKRLFETLARLVKDGW